MKIGSSTAVEQADQRVDQPGGHWKAPDAIPCCPIRITCQASSVGHECPVSRRRTGHLRPIDAATARTVSGSEGIRTPDPLHAMQVRYQLRHRPVTLAGQLD